MNIEAVRAFVAVAEEGQFQLAADRLDVSQQAVSKRIAALEAELGTVLFKRTPSGAALTQDGRTFLPHAGAILAAVSAAFASVQPGTRPLRVDVLSRGSGPVDLLRDFCADNQGVAVEMVIGGGAASTFKSLLAGEIDAGYAYLRDVKRELDPALARTYAFLEPGQVIVGVRHPLATARAVRAAELARYRAWVPGIVDGSEWETYFHDFADAFGLDIDPTGYAVGSESVFDAIAASRSLMTLVGERNRVGWPGGLGLVRLPIVDPVPLYPWSLVWRADTVHAGAKRLVSHVKRTYEPPSGGTAVWLPRQARDDLQLFRTTAGSAAPARRVRGGAVMMGAVTDIRSGITKEAAGVDFALTEDQLRFKEAAREFLSKEVIPYRAEWDRRESVDTAIIGKLGELGFFGLTIPEEYGGLGGDYITYCIGMEELGRADSAVRGIVSVSTGLFGKSVLSHGSEEQKQEWLPGIASGTKLGCFALTEPDNGSDAGNLKTRADRSGGDWIINGTKIFITNGSWADICVVFARTGGPGPRGVSAFLVPTGTPGFGRTEIHGKLGLRGQVTSELIFTDVRVPAGAMLGAEGEGFKIAMHSLDKGRVSVAAGCTGISQACLEAVVEYTGSRSQFGRPIAGFQLIQDMIAEISVDTDAARLLTWRAADLIERGLPFRTEASKAKFFASEKAVKAANLAIQAFGGYGYIDEYPVQKFMRDARVMTLYEGTSQIQKLLIGRAETGVSAF